MHVKQTLILIAALALFGCQDRPKTEEPVKPLTNATLPQGHPPIGQTAGQQQADPHAGLKATDLPVSTPTKKATVLQTIDVDIYTYIEAKGEDGKVVWMALPKTSVAKGTTIEYPTNVPPMINFASKTLNKTFDSILFLQGIKIVK